MKAKLVVVKGANPAAIQINKFPATIGRSKDVSLKLGTTAVSRQHCEIAENGGALIVRDLGSTNGTFVNKGKVETPTELGNGDLLRVGPVTFRAVITVDPKPAVVEEVVVEPEEDDGSMIDLGAEEVGEPGPSMSQVGYRDTPDGSFINIDESVDEVPAVPKNSGLVMDDSGLVADDEVAESEKETPVQTKPDAKAQPKQDSKAKPEDKSKAKSEDKQDMFAGIGADDEEEDKTVSSGDDEALDDFLKGLG